MTNDELARREIALLSVMLLAVVVFYFLVIPNGIADPEGFGLDQGLPPSFTARVAAILIALILGAQLLWLLLNPLAAKPEAIDPANAAAAETGSTLRNVAGILCAVAFAFVLVPLVGYYIASVCMIAALMFIMGERRLPYLIGQPAAVMGLIWVLFDRIFSIKLPAGWLFG